MGQTLILTVVGRSPLVVGFRSLAVGYALPVDEAPTVKSFAVRRNPFTAIDHVQLAMPRGGEETARCFFRDLLGMTEVPKPPELAKRGGCWFASGDVQIHLGVEDDFRAAKKAHPALRCAHYEDLLSRLRAAGVPAREDDSIPGVRRCHVFDPFGNRIELIG